MGTPTFHSRIWPVGHRRLVYTGTERESKMEMENRQDLRTFHHDSSLLPGTLKEPPDWPPLPRLGSSLLFELKSTQTLG